jgi:hypothetical protein
MAGRINMALTLLSISEKWQQYAKSGEPLKKNPGAVN